jgi:hypothetical protein
LNFQDMQLASLNESYPRDKGETTVPFMI